MDSMKIEGKEVTQVRVNISNTTYLSLDLHTLMYISTFVVGSSNTVSGVAP